METFLKVMRIIGIIADVVKGIETGLPMSGSGRVKKDAAIGILTDSGAIDANDVPVVDKVIDRLVKAFNDSGTFPRG